MAAIIKLTTDNMLQGIELIDCAKANAKQGVETAAKLCGYKEDTSLFMTNLNNACQEIGVDISEIEDLITDQQIAKQKRKVLDIAPDTTTSL